MQNEGSNHHQVYIMNVITMVDMRMMERKAVSGREEPPVGITSE